MKLLALDLGTKTGWALHENGCNTSGTWVLAKAKEIRAQKLAKLDRCCDMRAGRLNDFIASVEPNLDAIWFEDVQFASTTYQGHLWGGLRAVVQLRYPRIRLVAIPVGTLKKFATNHGGATKDMMAKHLLKILPLTVVEKMDDNEVDARWLLAMATKDL